MIDRIQQTRRNSVVRVLEVVEGCVERQTGAHPEEHSGSQTITRCPEIVFTVAYETETQFVMPKKNANILE